MAGVYYEKLDGMGYFWGVNGDEISLMICIIIMVDIFDIFSVECFYCVVMFIDKVFVIMEENFYIVIDLECFVVLKKVLNLLFDEYI